MELSICSMYFMDKNAWKKKGSPPLLHTKQTPRGLRKTGPIGWEANFTDGRHLLNCGAGEQLGEKISKYCQKCCFSTAPDKEFYLTCISMERNIFIHLSFVLAVT